NGRAPSCAGSAIPGCGAGSTCTPPRTTRSGRRRTSRRRRRRPRRRPPPRRPPPLSAPYEDGREGEEMNAHVATAHAAHEHHEMSFVRTYVFSTDHKMIARQFLFMGLLMMVLGGLLALIVRWQLAWPETAVPGLGMILKETGGILEPSTYNMAFTM